MLDYEEKGKSTLKSTFTTSFVPRQLLLSSASSKSIMAQQQKKNSRKPNITLSPQDRVRLLHTICEFLELNGFHKTLKKFRREADIEKNSLKNCSLNLEEMFQEHLRMRNDPDEKVLGQKDKSAKHTGCVETDEITKENRVDNGKKSEATLDNDTASGDDIKAKKKKKSKSTDMSDQVNAENHLKTSEHEVGDASELAEAGKKYKKKKQKDTSELSDKDLKEQPIGDALSVPSEPVKKLKDKKKKHKDESEVLDKNAQQKNVAEAVGATSEKADDLSMEEKKDKSKSRKMKEGISISKDEVDEAGKGSKKRKKSLSDDFANNDVEERATDDPKRSKMDDSDKSNEAVLPPKTPKQTANGFMEKDGEKAHKQDKTKECNGSAEPTSVKAFQRVKAEEVKFTDDRLKDNSYWAKDGAESGYGAKAQEILGQVRGRDFRHEKTKKKRGSYKGGQIDLQSHSIKFNYDDEDDE